jgi:hypothetical protein
MQYDARMKHFKNRSFCLCLMSLILLGGCETPMPETSVSRQEPVIEEEVLLEQIPQQEDSQQISDYILRARILADMLYEASLAFEDGRLLFPAGDNAYDRYQEVLSFFPDNPIALQGIEDIVTRYVSMANSAIENAQFDDAAEYLARAASIRPQAAAIAESRAALERERAVKRDFFQLDPIALRAQSLEMMSLLGSIGEYVKNQDATFLITARDDAEGRWIYSVMREAVGGYRLRGNITLGSRPNIQVNVPQS